MNGMRGKATWRILGAVSVMVLASTLVACGDDESGTGSGGEFDAEEFFSGKTITIVANSPAGAGSDVFIRLVAKDLGQYIPGEPEVTVTNVDGLAGIQEVYDAPDDRLILGSASHARELYSFALDSAADYDPLQFNIVGAMDPTPRGIVIGNDALEAYPGGLSDAFGSSGPPFKVTEEVADASTVLGYPFLISWMCDRLDLPCEMKKVAEANSDAMQQAITRGDINIVETNLAALFQRYSGDLASGKYEVMATYGEDNAATFESPYELPDLVDIIPSDEDKTEFVDQVLPLIGSGGLALPIFAGPDFPQEALDVIGEAFTTQFEEDPELLDETTQARMGEVEDVAYTPIVIPADDAAPIYDQYTNSFNENQAYYKEQSEAFYDEFWD